MKISYTLPVGNCAFVDDEALFPLKSKGQKVYHLMATLGCCK